jgi:uncharacterized protein involved in exopolysaccharide biosynthesis
MTEKKHRYKTNEDMNDFISLGELVKLLWQGKLWALCGTILGFTAAMLIGNNTPDQYKAEMVLAPVSVDTNDNLSASLNKISGLASIAGFGQFTQGVDKATLNLEKFKSRQFGLNFIRKHNLEIQLLTAQDWNDESNTLIFNDEIYDSGTKEWKVHSLVEAAYPPKNILLERFRDTFSINQDKSNGIIIVSATFYSPFLAKEWLQILVNDINESIRLEDTSNLEQSIEFLNEKIGNTSVSEIREIFYQLLEAQTKKLMLANANEDYAFTIIDPPIVPEEKATPKVLLWCAIGSLLGFTGSIVAWLIFWQTRNKKLEPKE